jgi:hypothetical protein
MKRVITFLAALIVLTICSCGSVLLKTAERGIPASLPLQSSEQAIDSVESVERKVIKEGSISFATADVNETKLLITRSVQELNGYIADDNIHNYSGRQEHRLIIRVPADKFDLLLEAISESVNNLTAKISRSLT